MKVASVLLLSVLLAAALSGCSGKKSSGDDGTDTPTDSSMDTNTPPPTTSEPPPPPPEPMEIFNDSFSYNPSGNTGDMTFLVDSNATNLVITYTIVAPSTGPWFLRTAESPSNLDAPPPALNLTNPDMQGISFHFDPDQGANLNTPAAEDVIVDPTTKVAPLPLLGSWTIGIYGAGNNVRVDVVIVEIFT